VVNDTGIGITRETLANLFSPFVQGEMDSARSRGGLGLGLSVVKALVDLHGGTVEAHSPGRGHGTRVTVRLPLVDALRFASAPDPADSTPVASRAFSLRILIVEDNRDAAEALAEYLKMSGHVVEVASEGVEGVHKAAAFRPEAILCDIGLPGDMDGYAVARRIRATRDLDSVRLIAVSGYGQPDDKRRAREAGFEAHFTKPVDGLVLSAFLARPHGSRCCSSECT
jgi:two-component system, sensor histidine kinase